MKRQVGLFIALLLATIVVIFTLGNFNSILVTLFFWKFRMPLALLIFICLIIGYIIALITMSFTYNNQHQKIKQLESQVKRLQSQTFNQEPVKKDETL